MKRAAVLLLAALFVASFVMQRLAVPRDETQIKQTIELTRRAPTPPTATSG